MKALLLAVVLVAACQGVAVGPTKPPNELLFVSGPQNQVSAYEASDGSPAGPLPAGAFDATLTGGGDLDEAYVAGDDLNLYRVRAGRPLRVDRLDAIRGAGPYQVALVPAPRLTNFVGARTVLVVKGADGSLFGYQAGRQLWREGVPQDAQLLRVDSVAVIGYAGAWSLIAPENGREVPLASDCPDAPLAEVRGAVVFDCAGTTPPAATLNLPAGPAYDLRPVRREESVLAYPSGDWFRIDPGPRLAGQGHGPGGEGRPGLSPDGGTLYWPGSVSAASVAVSRDGNFLYALGTGGLRVLAAADRKEIANYRSVTGTDILLVSGG
ncbi:MAG TPA: hypothetical protein VF160_02045 [Candidatus Dormibacteraeota bacterium]